MMIKALTTALALFSSVNAYTAKDREETNEWIKSLGFPLLDAFTNMTPKMTKTVFETYGRVTNDDAFEYLSAFDLEIVYTAVSAANNCELCLSFHAAALVPQSDKISVEDVNEIVQGGLPKDKKLRGLVQAAKYVFYITHSHISPFESLKHNTGTRWLTRDHSFLVRSNT